MGSTRVFEWFETGDYSIKQVTKMARAAGVRYRRSQFPVGISTIHNMLRNRLYAGAFEWGGRLYHGTHEPLVAKETWENVQEMLGGRSVSNVRATPLRLLKRLRVIQNSGPFLFPALHTSQRPMCENTLNVALRRLGYGSDEMTSHGFRAIASTLLNESGLWHPNAIERALAHQDRDHVRAAYHRGTHWDERVRMAGEKVTIADMVLRPAS